MDARDIINRAAARTRDREAQAFLRAYENRPSLATRRAFLKGAGAGVIVTAIARRNKSWASIGAVGRSSAGIGNGGAGFYPIGHWNTANFPMRLEYPIQDGSTSSWAPFQYAYWDGSIGLKYGATVVVGFGAPPYVFILMAAPSWLTLGAGIWSATWNYGGTAPAVAGYGKVSGIPTGALTGQTDNVWVRVYSQDGTYIDVKWNLNTSSDIAHGGVFCFIANSGAVSPGSNSNPGTLASPFLDFQGSHGTSSTTVVNAGAQVFVRGSTVNYNLNPYGTGSFNFIGSKKPVAILGYPGETATLDATTAEMFPNGQDVLMANLSASGYVASAASYKFISIGGSRQCYDNIALTGSGYGASSSNNAAMFFSVGEAPSFSQNIAITGCSDSNRAQSGFQTNNYVGASLFSLTDVVIQYCDANNPSMDSDGCWYLKGNINYGVVRGCRGIFASCTHGFDFGQAGGGGSGDSTNNETCFNTGLGVDQIKVPQVSGTGPEYAYRNTLLTTGAGVGLFSAEANSNGPWVFNSNSVQTSVTPQPNTGTSIQTDGRNLSASSGLVNSDGSMGSSYIATYGSANSAYVVGSGIV